jgi:hypothetical protein
MVYMVSQNSRIPNSECGREGPSGARKILRKKIALPEEDTGCPKNGVLTVHYGVEEITVNV